MNFTQSASQAIPTSGLMHGLRRGLIAIGKWLEGWRKLFVYAHAAVGLDEDLSDGREALKRANKLLDSQETPRDTGD